ncbi:MAG TPA: DUF5615 family PIN-like protein [Pirellulales bacterium]|nr:DUF5615 family PIN-like protein [Pirellulales bacterium]
MTLQIYIDENVDAAIPNGLRRRGVDVLTVQDDGNAGMEDTDVINRPGELGRVLFSNDSDMLRQANRRQRGLENFSGVIYAHRLWVPIGRCVDDLELIANICETEECAGRVIYLPK